MTEMPNDSQSGASRHSTHTGVLLRSRIEIGLVLDTLLRDACPVYTVVRGERLFLSRMLHVDPEREFFVVAYGDEKEVNASVLELESLSFEGHVGYSRVEFSGAHPSDTSIGGQAGIRLEFPDALARFPRREHHRYAVAPDASLRCVADASGVAPFEARITDISQAGMGTMIYDPSIRLERGTMLKGCRIVIPRKRAVVVDLEVRYAKLVLTGDGTQANRAGVRIVKASDKLDELLQSFTVVLDEPEAGGKA